MNALDFAQVVAVVVLIVWVAVLFMAARIYANTPTPEIYTQDELSQMLATENQKHRPRLRAGAIKETP